MVALRTYDLARQEHAWLLKAEDTPLHEIAQRLGVKYNPRQTESIIMRFGYRVSQALAYVPPSTVRKRNRVSLTTHYWDHNL